MSLQVNIGWLLVTILLSVRIAAATMLAPVFGPASIPAPVKVFIGIALSAYMVSVLEVSAAVLTPIEFAAAAFQEAVVGLAFGFGFMAAHASTQLAGRILDIQMGFGAANILNPTTQTPSPLLGSLFGVVMVAAFLALDGHHVLLRALAISVAAMPPGADTELNLLMTLQHSSVMFVFGLAVAAPVMFLLWLSDIAMAVFARSMPQLNVFLLSFAVKIILGILGLALTIGVTKSLFERLFDSTFRYWDGLSTV